MSTLLKSTYNDLILFASGSNSIYTSATFLMCPPKFYEVNYVINPWMEGNIQASSQVRAQEQWMRLYNALKQIVNVVLVEPQLGLPDMVFTANAGLERDGKILLSNFVHPERQGEENYFYQWFLKAGYSVMKIPREIYFEGEGDALFAIDNTCLWAGYGIRTLNSSHRYLSQIWDIEVISLHLVNPRFYHLDTCFAPLQDGYVMYYPSAFDEASTKKIEKYYPLRKRIVVSETDALHFACNAINVDRIVIANEISSELNDRLEARGFHLIQHPLGEFLMAGGSAKCLVMKLSGTIQE